MFKLEAVWMVYGMYGLYVVWNQKALALFLKRTGHATLFSLCALAGFLAMGKPIEWHLVLGPGFLFFSTYIINAFYDQAEDTINGRELVLSEEHRLLQYLFIVGFLGSFIQAPKSLGLFLGLFVLTELYHNPKFRLKKVMGFQSISEGVGAGLCFCLGGYHPLAIGLGLIFGMLSQIKDVSDYEGDSQNRIQTWFVILVERYGKTEAIMRIDSLFMSVVKLSFMGTVVMLVIDPSYLLFYGSLFLVVVHEGFSMKSERELFGLKQESEANILFANLLIIGQLGLISTLGGLL